MLIKTNRLILRALNEGDVDGPYFSWLNDPEIIKFNSHGRFPQTKQSLLDYTRSANSQSKIVLAIVDLEQNIHIGNISLQNINWIDRNAEIAFLLGDKNYWGKGIMYEAGKAVIRHAFESLNLHRIYCGTSVKNAGMIRLADKLNFVKEGERTQALYKNGEYIDILEFGLINNG